MDAHDIFKKLSVGASFKRKKVPQAAVQPLHINGEALPVVVKQEPEEVTDIREPEVDQNPGPSSSDGRKERKRKSSPVTFEDLRCPINVDHKEDRPTTTPIPPLQSKKTPAEEKYDRMRRERIASFRNDHRIHVKGRDIPDPIESFEQFYERFNTQLEVLGNLYKMGYRDPTPIQMQALPIIMKERQILACAPTGSGKTAAFVVPLLAVLKKPSKKGFRALILCPTRELARQTFRECLKLSEKTGIKAHIISKVSSDSKKFGSNFSKKFDILISTPNRLIYLMRKEENVIDLKRLQWLVVDECDKLFEEGTNGFRDQMSEIHAACDTKKLKRLMFSATHMTHLAHWCQRNLEGLISVTIGQRNTTAEKVKQELIYVGDERGKLLALRELISKGLSPPILIFVQTKDRARELFRELLYDEMRVDVIHAERTELERDNVVTAFREGKIWMLICTELMGRGIDFKGVKVVINYDFPTSAVSYIHRIGRTGRAGRDGQAFTFFTEEDKPIVRSIAVVMKESGCDVPDFMLQMKKTHKITRRKIEKHPPKRGQISTEVDSYKKFMEKKRFNLQEAGEPSAKRAKFMPPAINQGRKFGMEFSKFGRTNGPNKDLDRALQNSQGEETSLRHAGEVRALED